MKSFQNAIGEGLDFDLFVFQFGFVDEVYVGELAEYLVQFFSTEFNFVNVACGALRYFLELGDLG